MKQLSRLALGVAFAAGLIACERAPEGPDAGERARDALQTAKIDDVNVDYDRDSQVVHLKGSVDTAAEKQRAEQVASQAVGTSGRVLNEITVDGPAEDKADDMDRTIRTQLNDRVDADLTLKDRDVNFDVNNGAVEAKGTVATAAEKAKVTEMVKAVPGVKDFVNAIEVRPDEFKDAKRPATTK
jgi:osmotically-inducible protein OsmY